MLYKIELSLLTSEGKNIFIELITSQIQHYWDKQVTHAHMQRNEVADEGDQNRNQP